MPNIHVYLSVKFRAFGITYGTVSRDFTVECPPGVPQLGKIIDYDKQGIRLIVVVR